MLQIQVKKKLLILVDCQIRLVTSFPGYQEVYLNVLEFIEQHFLRNMTLEEEFDREIFVYGIVMKFNASVCVLSTALAMYLIFYKTPQELKEYSYYLLNISCWSFASDIYQTMFYRLAHPFPARYSLAKNMFFAEFCKTLCLDRFVIMDY